MNLPWTHAGMPAATLPAGLAGNGLPLGLQLVARFGEDEALLGWAELISERGFVAM
ncbi:MAG: amidase family protein [Caldilineales bacterium]